jgi:putative PIN family toxin of toxin-antitoxin system
MRAVLDTNVIISAALVLIGGPSGILQAAKRREFDLVISESLLSELERVLSRRRIAGRLGWSGEERSAFLHDIRNRAIVVAPTKQVKRIAVDPPENRVLEAAVEGRADYIVTGDTDLLELGRHDDTEIVTPARFLAILTSEARNP